MLKRSQNITTNISILSGLALLCAISVNGQTISNTGASFSINSNTVVSSASVNNSSGTISNNGTLNLSADYSNGGSVNGNGAYNVGGNWTNNGTFTAGTSTVTFNGSSQQTLSGTSATQFNNITINGAGGIKLSQNASFTSILDLAQGTISGADTMTLISNASGTGMMTTVGAGVSQSSITAMFTIQRYESQRTKANYIVLSTPVGNTKGETYSGNALGTIGDWNVQNRAPVFYMSGIGGPDGNASSYVSVKKYVESTNAYNNITTYVSPGIKYNAKPGEGLYLWLGTGLSTMVSPFSYNTHGVPNIGAESIAVTYTSGKGAGFNTIGNPYPCPIDWASFQASNPSLQTSYYLFEQDGSWHTFSSGSIPIGQGFGVITSGNTTINFSESHKTLVDASMLRQADPSDEPNTATFILSDDANDYSCPTIITFGSAYNKNYFSTEDAYYIPTYLEEAPQVYTTSDDSKNLMLNMMPDNDETIEVPLTVLAGVNGIHTLTAKNLGNVTSYNCIMLIDANTGAVLNNFLDNPEYKFAVNNAPETRKYIVRFNKLSGGQLCSPAGSIANGGVEIYPSAAGAYVSLNLQQSGDVLISTYDMLGRQVSSTTTYSVQNQVVSVALPETEAIYIVRVQTSGGIFTQKIYHKRAN